MGSAMSDFTNYDAIIEAIEAYIDGAKTGRSDRHAARLP